MSVEFMPCQIKNCGLNTLESVHWAVDAGASYLGFVLYPPSPRAVSVDEAARLTRNLPANIHTVAVMVNPSDDDLRALLPVWQPRMLQLHGDESESRVQELKDRFSLRVIKAVPIATQDDIATAHAYSRVADMLLFDTKVEQGVSGGTGHSFDWSLLANEVFDVHWFLSGGLTCENVQDAIRITSAKKVDVSSGIEASRGVKDAEKLRLFNQTVLECHG